MRAAGWLQSRDMVAARTSWERARRIADRLPDTHEQIAALRAAPRTMLTWTEWLIGCDPGAETCYAELRALSTESGDVVSLAIGIAGRMTALCTNYSRPQEAAVLAADLVGMIDHVDTDAMGKVDLLFTVMWAQFLACDYSGALRTADRIRIVAGTEVNSSVARANAVAGVSKLVIGDHEQGRRELRIGLEQARQLDPVTYAALMALNCGLTAVGLEAADNEMLNDARETLRRAEAFGDNFGLACALWACGTVLLRIDRRPVATAIELLERARSIMSKHRTCTVGLAPVEADLAVLAARTGHSDDAIRSMREVIRNQIEDSNATFLGVTTAALVQLLVDRGGTDEIVEATAAVQVVEAAAAQFSIPALEVCATYCRFVLAAAGGDAAAYANAVDRYRAVMRRVGAHGEFLPLRPIFAVPQPAVAETT
jgi:adenylate cyclase